MLQNLISSKTQKEKMTKVVLKWWYKFVRGVRVVQIARGLYQKIDRNKVVMMVVFVCLGGGRWRRKWWFKVAVVFGITKERESG